MSATFPLHELVRRTSAPPRRVALLAKGFRVFFLLATVHALLALPLWLVLWRQGGGPAYLPGQHWHAHEMLFGFATAVLAGFLLTAASQWTGRETATGATLGALALLWVAGRVGCTVPPLAGTPLAVGLDLAFLPALGVAVARPLLTARSRRNYPFLGVIALLFLANLATHLGALGAWPVGLLRGPRVAVDLFALAITLLGGRIVPMFTRNATGRADVRSVPLLDVAAALFVVALLTLDAAGVEERYAALVAASAGLLGLLRARRWGTASALRTPLLGALHVGVLFVPLGLVLRGAAPWVPALASLWLHALTAGGIGVTVVAMMARVTLGHTGRPLAAGPWFSLAFALVGAGAGLRVLSPLSPAHYVALVTLAGVLFATGLALLLVRAAPMWWWSRVDGRPG